MEVSCRGVNELRIGRNVATEADLAEALSRQTGAARAESIIVYEGGRLPTISAVTIHGILTRRANHKIVKELHLVIKPARVNSRSLAATGTADDRVVHQDRSTIAGGDTKINSAALSRSVVGDEILHNKSIRLIHDPNPAALRCGGNACCNVSSDHVVPDSRRPRRKQRDSTAVTGRPSIVCNYVPDDLC